MMASLRRKPRAAPPVPPALPGKGPRHGRKAAAKPATKGRAGRKHPFTVFLDRDGVLNRDLWPGVLSPRRFEWLPGAREALARLNRPDVRVCIVTNQPWTHTGILTPRRLAAIHDGLRRDAEAAGGRIDAIEAATWPWGRRRKPRPGLLEDAGAAVGTDKARAVMVGDKRRDIEAGRRYGIPGIRVGPKGDVPDLAAAVDRILAMLGG